MGCIQSDAVVVVEEERTIVVDNGYGGTEVVEVVEEVVVVNDYDNWCEDPDDNNGGYGWELEINCIPKNQYRRFDGERAWIHMSVEDVRARWDDVCECLGEWTIAALRNGKIAGAGYNFDI
jgi:hypothetical protein